VKETIIQAIAASLSELGVENPTPILEHPGDLANGDYSTNVALMYSKKLGISPKALAEKVVAHLTKEAIPNVSTISIAGPGFINITLAAPFYLQTIETIRAQGAKWGTNNLLSGKKIMVEYTDPNPFKPFHIGHLMTNAIGESVARVIEASGATLIRANYQGDVGLHVAKAIWGIMQKGKPDESLSISVQARYIGECYSYGSEIYESEPAVKTEIDAINKKIYEKSDEAINAIYDWGRAITLEAFEEIYKLLGTQFNYYFFESEMAEKGIALVREWLAKGVFTESDGAIVFHGEKYNPKLHTRVFINSAGLPTYETKEIGLVTTKFEKENPDLSITVTAIEQGEYMRVVTEAMRQMFPLYADRMKHITHGMMRFASGKMSSRKGNVVTGESLLQDTYDHVIEIMKQSRNGDKTFVAADSTEAVDEKFETEVIEVAQRVGVAAIKYSILRQAIGGDIIYDFEKSISFEGDSGPYLQYTVVRAKSVLAKVSNPVQATLPTDWQPTELEKILYRYPEIVERASTDLEPHHIAVYLTELASAFNSFYANHQIVKEGDEASAYKVALTEAFMITMQNGLQLLGISVPVRM
jgi:arginyl-tRNA synthetase